MCCILYATFKEKPTIQLRNLQWTQQYWELLLHVHTQIRTTLHSYHFNVEVHDANSFLLILILF